MLRKTRYRWGAVLVSLGLLGAACTSTDDGGAGADRTTLEIVMSEEVEDLIPFTATQQGKSAVLQTLYMPLLETDDENEIFSKMLESWETSDDARTVTLKLKPDLEWNDGEPMTSADVIMTLTQVLDSNISNLAGRIGGVAGQEEYVAGTADTISGLTAPDDLTVQIVLANPDVAWLPNLAAVSRNIPPLPSHVLGEVPHDQLLDHEFFKTHPVTNGPYQFVEFVPGQHVEFKKNPNWSLGEAGFERVFFKILSTDVMSAQLETGEIQLMYPVDPTDADRIDGIDGIDIQSTTGVAPELWSPMYYEPLLDPRIRQAMVYAIDREGICQEALGGHCTTPLTNTRQIAPEWSIPTDDMIEYRYDPDKARQLLAEAGWDPNTKLTFFHRPDRSYVNSAIAIAQGNLRDVGMDWEVVNTDTGGLLDSLERGAEDLQGFWVSGADFSVDPSAAQAYTSCSTKYPAGANTTHYCDPELDTLWAAGRQETDQDKRATIYHDAFRRLNQNPAEMYLYVVDSIVAYDARLKGVEVHGSLTGQYWNIGEWRWEE